MEIDNIVNNSITSTELIALLRKLQPNTPICINIDTNFYSIGDVEITNPTPIYPAIAVLTVKEML